MRGVIALAAAIALPQALPDGSPFPQRNMIIFLAFVVILVTLVLQGLTLPLVVRLLKVTNEGGPNIEEEEARREILRTALAYLLRSRKEDEDRYDALYEDLIGHYEQRLSLLEEGKSDEASAGREQRKHFNRLSRDLLLVERQTAVRLRNSSRISDETLRQIERELDLREAGEADAW
jgi:CPA1 family monovalent cation:H+ antiporter